MSCSQDKYYTSWHPVLVQPADAKSYSFDRVLSFMPFFLWVPIVYDVEVIW